MNTQAHTQDPRCGFAPRRWLLVDLQWTDLPQHVRDSPWARWRHDAGLVHEVRGRNWGKRVLELLEADDQARLSVVAERWRPDGADLVTPWGMRTKDAYRLSWHPRTSSARELEADPLQGLRALLGPEPEGLDLAGSSGQALLSWPRGLPAELVERWQTLVSAWAETYRQRLGEVCDTPEEAAAAWQAEFEHAPITSPIHAVDGAQHWAAGDEALETVVLAAAGTSHSENTEEFKLDCLGSGKWSLTVTSHWSEGTRHMPRFQHMMNQAGWGEHDGSLVGATLDLTLPDTDLQAWSGDFVLHDGMGPAIVLSKSGAIVRPKLATHSEADKCWTLIWTWSAKDLPGLAIRLRHWRETNSMAAELRDAAPGKSPG